MTETIDAVIGRQATVHCGVPYWQAWTSIEIDGVPILVASLNDIVRSKRAAAQPRDLAVLDILEKSLEKRPGRRQRSPRSKKQVSVGCEIRYAVGRRCLRSVGPTS